MAKNVLMTCIWLSYLFTYEIISATHCRGYRSKLLDCSLLDWKLTKDFLDNFKNPGNITELALTSNNIDILDNQVFTKYVNLRRLDLDHNKLSSLDPDVFKGLYNLRILNLGSNCLSEFPKESMKHLQNLRDLSLRNNRIKSIKKEDFRYFNISILTILDLSINSIGEIKDDTFEGFSNLQKLFLMRMGPGKMKIADKAFRNLRSLVSLDLNDQSIELINFPDFSGTDNLERLRLTGIKKLQIPSEFCPTKQKLKELAVTDSTMVTFPNLQKCKKLQCIIFRDNEIGELNENSFSGLPNLAMIDMLKKKKEIKYIHENTYSNLPALIELDLSHSSLKKFPNLTGTSNLRKLNLNSCQIKDIPNDLCSNLKRLSHFDISMNEIRVLPDLSYCRSLEILNLCQNRIATIDKQLKNLVKLKYLYICDNHITEITNNTLSSLTKLKLLSAKDNLISKIHINSFRGITNLQKIDLSDNKLSHLPTNGLQSLVEVNVSGNKDLIEFAKREDLPNAQKLNLVYRYHCCFFMKKVEYIKESNIKFQFLSKYSDWKILDESHRHLSHFWGENLLLTYDRVIQNKHMEPYLRRLNMNTTIYFRGEPNQTKHNLHVPDVEFVGSEVLCTPTPNEFYPCEDLMGEEWLRTSVWIVFFLALFGNISVFTVLCINHRKIDVPRCLVVNLAFADSCLAMYLGFLAFVDIKTLGNFRLHALQWQFSASCQIAGFLAVFASELSVFTLVAITVERYITIKYSMRREKRLSKKQVLIIILLGWLFAGIVASLPLLNDDKMKFSDYRKYSICLPFDIETSLSKGYVTFLLVFNLLAFITILICYIKIYWFIRGSNAWNSSDFRVAKRMAILVFTDFLCWFPISLVALSTVFGKPLIKDLWISKVLTILVFPLNACANPFLYAIFTKQFKKDFSSVIRRIRQTNKSRDLSKSLLKLPMKSSVTYSTSVRRESSCSFLFSRRTSTKSEEIKCQTKGILALKQQYEGEDFGDYKFETGEEENLEQMTAL